MPVYKTFLKIINHNKMTIIMYLGIFLGINMIISSLTGGTRAEVFSTAKISVAVIDRDQSDISQTIKKYMGQTQYLKDIPDDKDALQDALFFRDVEYVLIIPEGFGESLMKEGTIQLDNINVPNSYSGIYVNMQLEQFLTTLKAYMVSGQDAETALQSSLETTALESKVTLLTEDGSLSNMQKYTYYFQFIPYIMTSVMIQIIGTIMLAFNKEDVRRRMLCSSTSLKSRNLQLALGCITLSILVWSLTMLISVVMYGSTLLNSGVFPYLLLNSFVFTVVGVSLGFCISSLAKNQIQLSGLATTVSLTFCFLGGVFVSMTYMAKSMLSIAKFTPAYWYVLSNDMLGHLTKLSGDNAVKFFQNIGMQFAFAIAFFGLALAITKKKSNRIA